MISYLIGVVVFSIHQKVLKRIDKFDLTCLSHICILINKSIRSLRNFSRWNFKAYHRFLHFFAINYCLRINTTPFKSILSICRLKWDWKDLDVPKVTGRNDLMWIESIEPREMIKLLKIEAYLDLENYRLTYI